MGAPKRNNFWEQRSKHGRGKAFATPELLWKESVKYFEYCIDNPLLEHKAFNSKEGITYAYIELPRVFTLVGLTLFLGVSENYFRNFESNNKDSEDFMAVIEQIRKTIYDQKFSGAAAGQFNASIIARDLGLAEKREVTKIKVGADTEETEYVD